MDGRTDGLIKQWMDIRQESVVWMTAKREKKRSRTAHLKSAVTGKDASAVRQMSFTSIIILRASICIKWTSVHGHTVRTPTTVVQQPTAHNRRCNYDKKDNKASCHVTMRLSVDAATRCTFCEPGSRVLHEQIRAMLLKPTPRRVRRFLSMSVFTAQWWV